MYIILLVNTFPSGNILTFVRYCHRMAWYMCKCVTNALNVMELKKIFHKRLQCPWKFFNWHRTIYVQNVYVQYKVFVRCVLYCMRWACIGCPLIKLAQQCRYFTSKRKLWDYLDVYLGQSGDLKFAIRN